MVYTLQHGDCAFGTGCFTRYDAKSSLLVASQNIIRNFQYRVLSKVRFETVTGASKYVIDKIFDAGCSISYSTKRYWVLHKV